MGRTGTRPIRDLDRFRFVKRPAGATHDPGELGRDSVFFPFSNVVSVLHPPFLFHHLLYNELLLAAVERKGE